MFRGRSRARPRLADLYRHERGRLAGWLRDVAPDIVHSHWTYEFELAAQDSGIPHVTTAHDAPITILRHMKDPYRAARLAVALRARPRIHCLSAVSPYLAFRWRREMAYRRHIAVIPNSIPRDTEPPARRPAPHPVILEVADSSERKNVRGLLHAFGWVRARVPEADLRLVGPGLGPDDKIARWAAMVNLARGVTFVGPVGRAQLADEYSAAWVLAHASLEEACPMTLLEAHGADLPILGGRMSGGVPFVLDHGRAGWLTDVKDAEVFGRDLVALLASGPPAPKPGAEEYVTRTFSQDAVTTQYTNWYETALSAGAQGAK